jgi:hypothetical protein
MISHERLRELLRYDPETGLFWWLVRTSSRVNMGKPAGSADAYGYRCIGIDGRAYKGHRLAWLYVQGVWPSKHIDHINGDPSDNRLINLREATNVQNGRNRGKNANTASGLKGVSGNASKGKWRSRIKTNGKIKHLGYFDCKFEAASAYAAAANIYHGEFARLE